MAGIQQISTQNFAHLQRPGTLPIFRAISPVSGTEVEETIKRMKLGEATGPDDIAAELWKAKNRAQ